MGVLHAAGSVGGFVYRRRRGAANGGEFGHRVWMLINLELWFRLYFADGATLGQPAPALAAS